MEAHPRVSDLIGLELGMLGTQEQAAVAEHLNRCAACRERRSGVRLELAAFGSELMDGNDERAHIPAAVLAEYAGAPSGVGIEITNALELHLARCTQCADELERSRGALQVAWAGLVASGRDERVASGTERERRNVPLSRLLLDLARRPRFLIGAAVVAGALVLIPLRLAGPQRSAITAGLPVRMTGGARGEGTRPVEVQAGRNTPLVLFLRPAGPIDPNAEYEMILSQAGGAVVHRTLPGATFDRSGTIAILIDHGTFTDGSPVEITVAPRSDPAHPIFQDAVVVSR